MKEKRDNSGALFTNDRKEAANHPDYSGSINIDGKEYWLSGWKKIKDDKAWLSLSVKPKLQPQAKPAPSSPSYQPAQTLSDEIPF